MADVKVYGTRYCVDCIRSKRFLTERGVEYDFIDLEVDGDALAYVHRLQNGGETIPMIVFADGSILLEPTNTELAAKLGLSLAAG